MVGSSSMSRMFSVYIDISSRYLQFGLKIEIERSKFGADLQKPCIPDTSDISPCAKLNCIVF